ncbi:hypothetical protein BYT27DRAFT_6636011 [Phlegmacium glaucopus]|nr:hypothetical protein BYT27DRAFT_6636011 [Phlegmacium glaucopus]
MSIPMIPNEEASPVSNPCVDLTHVNERVGTGSMLNLFPPEMLLEIFLQVVPAPRSFETGNSIKFPDHDHKSIFTLSQVCSYWRSVALSTPGLWTCIPFIYSKDRKNCRSDNFLALIRLFIERSGDTPIHITISICKLCMAGEYYDLIDEPIPHPAIDLILSHSHRWKSAIIHLDHYLFPLLGSLESEGESVLPILESLNVRSHYRDVYGPYTGPKNIFTNAPALRHAIFDGHQTHHCLNFPWSQLTSYIGLPDAMENLRPASAHLTTLVLRGPLSMMAYPSSSLQFPQLTSLRVEHTSHPYPHTFVLHPNTVFQYIVAPNLLSLEISDHPSEARAPRIVEHLISTTLSHCPPLQSLSFRVAGLTLNLLEKLLDAVPSLVSLDVYNIPPEDFYSLIFKTALTPDGLCAPRIQQLESLTIRGLSDVDDVDVTPLVDVYISRRLIFEKSQGIPQTKVPCIKLTYSSSSTCFQAQDQIEGWARHKDYEKGSEYLKLIGWRDYLAKQFLSRVSNIGQKYAIAGTPAQWKKYLCKDMSKINRFFNVIECHELEDVILLEVSRLTTIMRDISGMPAGVIPEDNVYCFRQRARSLMHKWTPMLNTMSLGRAWVVDDDFVSLRLVKSIEY